MSLATDPKIAHKHADIRIEFSGNDCDAADYKPFNPLKTRVPTGAIFGLLSQYKKTKRGIAKPLLADINAMPQDIQQARQETLLRWRKSRHRIGAQSTRRTWIARACLTEVPSGVVKKVEATLSTELVGRKRSTALLDTLILDESIPARAFAPLQRLRILHRFKKKPFKSAESDEYDRARQSLSNEVRRLR